MGFSENTEKYIWARGATTEDWGGGLPGGGEEMGGGKGGGGMEGGRGGIDGRGGGQAS